jgi:superfamily II DNA or RNA helicase
MQRLGRILRPKANKTAKLYEIVTKGTTEVNVSYRRRIKEEYFD